MDCPNHIVEADPDPHDWFCDDDQAVLCKLAENVEKKKRWWDGFEWEFRPIIWSCRPHHKRKECDRPEWCPLIKKLTYEELSAHASHCSEGMIATCPICEEFYKLKAEEPDKCICEGNFRNIIKKTESLFGKDFKDANNRIWEFVGVLWASDDFYYVFELESYDVDMTRYCSCCASIEQHGFTLIE
jgi:hypothetical protein